MNRTSNVLIVEDECVNAALLEDQLVKLGYRVPGVAGSGEEAILMAEQTRPDLVLMDIGLSGQLDGIETAGEIRRKWGIPIVFLTAASDEETFNRARQTDAHGYLNKPFHPRELDRTLLLALHKAEMEARIREEKKWLSTTLHCIRDGVIAADSTGLVKLMNSTAEKLTGWRQEDAIGRDLASIFPVLEPETREPAECAVVRVLQERSAAGLASRKILVSKEREETVIQESAASIDDESGVMIGVVLVFHTI